MRVIRACRSLNLKTVAVYSQADDNSAHIWAADHAICIGPAPAAQSYLNPSIVLQVAREMRCDAVHPGYGFLSERADFAAKCLDAGLTFVGPTPDAISMMGDKAEARRTALRFGLPVVPGSEEVFEDAAGAITAAAAVGHLRLDTHRSSILADRIARQVFTATKLIVDRCTASVLASASR